MKQLSALRELREKLGAEVFLVGGTVRDLVRGREPNDIDILVRNVVPSDFESFLRGRGDLRLVGKSFGVYLFRPEGSTQTIEVAFPRTEVSNGEGHRDFLIVSDPTKTIEEDSRRRDFTVNALYLDLEQIDSNGKFNRHAVVDFHNGLEHIRKRLIVAVGEPEDRILEDPLRMLRAVVLVARTGYRLDGDTFGAIKRKADLLRSVSQERIRDELIKVMGVSKPSRAFKVMARTGLLQYVLPELAECIGCGQNPKHHSYPVFEHLIYATDAACSLTSDLEVRFGALFHDLGKAPTRAVKPNATSPDDVSFHNHEIVSTKLAYQAFRRLRFPREFSERVIHLIRYHQYRYDREWTDKAVRRFIRNLGLTQEDLKDLDRHPQFLLRQADRMGNELKAHLPITPKQRDFQARLREVYGKSSAHSLRELKINGRDIMGHFEIPASPVIGRIMRALFDAVEETPKLNTRDNLLEMAGKLLQEERYRNGNIEANGEGPEPSSNAVE